MSFKEKEILLPATILTLLVALLAGYFVADVYDQVPGIFTLKPQTRQKLNQININLEAANPKDGWGLGPILQRINTSGGLFSDSSDQNHFSPVTGPSTDATPVSKKQVKDYLTVLADEAAHGLPQPPQPQKIKDKNGKIRLIPPPADQPPAKNGGLETGATVGAIVFDTATGTELGNLNADVGHTPASTSKLVATATGLTNLKPGKRFPTSTYSAENNLFLKGFGDEMLAEAQGNPQQIAGQAGLSDLAAATVTAWKEQHPTPAGQPLAPIVLYLDDTFFGPATPLPNWAENNNTLYETFPIPLAIRTGLKWPKLTNDYLPDPALNAAEVFKTRLTEAGLPISQVVRKTLPNGAKELATVHSATLDDIAYLALKHSDNMLAELMCRAAAIETKQSSDFAGEVHLAQQTLNDLGLPGQEFQNQDCSGLSTANRITPELLGHLLLKTTDEKTSILHGIPSALPRSGLDGTLQKRFLNSAATGKVWAKTGSLQSSRALAGFLETKSGRTLTFVVIVDGFERSQAPVAIAAIDHFIEQLVAL